MDAAMGEIWCMHTFLTTSVGQCLVTICVVGRLYVDSTMWGFIDLKPSLGLKFKIVVSGLTETMSNGLSPNMWKHVMAFC
jgi:hypothetical protein